MRSVCECGTNRDRPGANVARHRVVETLRRMLDDAIVAVTQGGVMHADRL